MKHLIPRPPLFRLLVLLLLIATMPPLAMATPEILSPPPSSTIYARDPSTHMIIRQQANEGIKQTRVRKGDLLFSPLRIKPHKGDYYLHFRLPLKPGKNHFEILPAGEEITINYRPLRSLLNVDFSNKNVFLFHRKQVLPEVCSQCHQGNPKLFTPQTPDLKFCIKCHGNIIEKNWQHSPAATLKCLSCHETNSSPLQIAIPVGKVESACFTCHTSKKAWLGMAHIHGPVGTGDCTVCHNPHADQNPNQLWADGKAQLCVSCHTDKESLVSGENSVYYTHGILEGSGCVACHSPHATENRFQLYKPINKLCVGCHTSFKGIVKGHPVGGHPVQGVKDPRRPERMFTCTSCHNPHGSDYKFLLIGDVLGGQVCSQCHY